MHKEIIEKEINKEVEIIKRFSGGMSNYTYLIKVENELFTYRIPGESSEVFVNRKEELENTLLIESLNLNCKNIYFNVDNGHKMSSYIEGADLTDYKSDYRDIALKLLLLHNSNIKAVNNYDMAERLNKYEILVNNKNDTYLTLKNKLFGFLEEYKNIEKVFCHNDAQKANWIKSNELYLLDWEFCGNNDPFYDIASFGNKDFNDAVILLKAYLNKEPNNKDLKRLMVNRMYQCLQWHNVALYKNNIGLSEKLNVNFEIIAQNYLVLASDFLNKINNL